MDPSPSRVIEIDHDQVHAVEEDVFRLRFVADCMTHACRCDDEGARLLPDACCQHGADVDLHERDRILERAGAVAAVLRPGWRDPARWFDDREPEPDPSTSSGTVIRTGVQGDHDASLCVFLAHDGRGCALHVAALRAGFSPAAIKPRVCRLYPLSYGDGILGLSDDFSRYSCATEDGGPTLYAVMRATLGDVFGLDLVRRLDVIARQVRARRLPVVARGLGR